MGLKRLVRRGVVHADDLAVSHLDIEGYRLTTDLTVLDELLVSGGEIDRNRGVLETVRTTENDWFFHLDAEVNGSGGGIQTHQSSKGSSSRDWKTSSRPLP